MQKTTVKKRILIIGGVAGGAAAATKIRRISEDAEIIIFERDQYISFANCGLPYHISGEIQKRERLLMQTPHSMKQRYNIDVRVENEVIDIDREHKKITVLNKTTRELYTENYDILILSPGAKPIVPTMPGIDSSGVFTLRNMQNMDEINNWIIDQAPEQALVIGGGYIGLEITEALHHRNIAVTIVELSKQVMGAIDPEMAVLLQQELLANNIELCLENAVIAINTKAEGHYEVTLKSGKVITTNMVIMAIGVKPEIDLASKSGLKIGELGGIVVNKYMQTSDPDIYAVGDAVEVNNFVTNKPSLIPLAGPASRQAHIAATHIFGDKNRTYKGTQGTGICRVFGLTVGMTGANEKLLKHTGQNYEKIYLHNLDHAGYYPGAALISLKLLFNPQNGIILGAQAIGAKGVDKRIDIIATAIRANFTVFDLTEEELSYAPPYGSAKDIINYAGFVASNVINGEVRICHTVDVLSLNNEQILLDVRTAHEYKNATIPGAINLPIDELRTRLHELPKNKEIIVFCQVGMRGYLACRVLMQHGFRCRNLTGGYITYSLASTVENLSI